MRAAEKTLPPLKTFRSLYYVVLQVHLRGMTYIHPSWRDNFDLCETLFESGNGI